MRQLGEPSATADDGTCILFGESNLPLIQITTTDPIVDDPRVVGNMKVTNLPGGFNTLADAPNEFDGQITTKKSADHRVSVFPQAILCP